MNEKTQLKPGQSINLTGTVVGYTNYGTHVLVSVHLPGMDVPQSVVLPQSMPVFVDKATGCGCSFVQEKDDPTSRVKTWRRDLDSILQEMKDTLNVCT